MIEFIWTFIQSVATEIVTSVVSSVVSQTVINVVAAVIVLVVTVVVLAVVDKVLGSTMFEGAIKALMFVAVALLIVASLLTQSWWLLAVGLAAIMAIFVVSDSAFGTSLAGDFAAAVGSVLSAVTDAALDLANSVIGSVTSALSSSLLPIAIGVVGLYLLVKSGGKSSSEEKNNLETQNG
jgi:hypothetical protein